MFFVGLFLCVEFHPHSLRGKETPTAGWESLTRRMLRPTCLETSPGGRRCVVTLLHIGIDIDIDI